MDNLDVANENNNGTYSFEDEYEFDPRKIQCSNVEVEGFDDEFDFGKQGK